MASEGGKGQGPYPGLLSGLCAVEDAGPDVRESWTGERAPEGTRRGRPDQSGGRSDAHEAGRGDSESVHCPADQAPGSPPPEAATASSPAHENPRIVVSTLNVCNRHLRYGTAEVGLGLVCAPQRAFLARTRRRTPRPS